LSPRLVAVSGPRAGEAFELQTSSLTVGRDSANLLHLRDPAVSRRHCVVEADGGGSRLRDLDSLHGTFVNGLPVHERALESGDLITIGGSLLLFQTEADRKTSPWPT
jgi:pSer/pThr/pTyr-binding forkhead associated (FHA) protein